MLKITRHLKLHHNYTSILDDDSKLFIKPLINQDSITFSGEFLIQKDGKLKKKYLEFQQHLIIYSKKKHVNILNATLIMIFDNQGEIEGLRFQKSGNQLEIYQNILPLYEYVRKFCIQRDISDKYKIAQTLYYGSNATFLLLESSLYYHKAFAAKVYEKQNIISDHDVQGIQKEVQIMRALSHQYMTNLVEIYENEELLFLIIDYLEGEELQSIIEKDVRFDEHQIKNIIKPLFQVIDQLQEKNVFHRDIKPQNIKFKSKLDLNEPCLIDFSLADFWNREGQYLYTRCGSVGYVAPEVLQDQKYYLNIDVYSLGIILFILVTKRHPFEDIDKNKMIQKNYQGKIDFTNLECSNTLKDLIVKCLNKDLTQRLNAKEALRHPFFCPVVPRILSFQIRGKKQHQTLTSPRGEMQTRRSLSKFSNDSYNQNQSNSPTSFDSENEGNQQRKTIFPEITIFKPKSKYFRIRKSQCETNKHES